jgi:hypothetical protein
VSGRCLGCCRLPVQQRSSVYGYGPNGLENNRKMSFSKTLRFLLVAKVCELENRRWKKGSFNKGMNPYL